MDNTNSNIEKVIIVGAGIAGLTAADLLSRSGKSVEIFESQKQIGGLATTYHYDGFFADAGPHRFHTSDASVLQYIKDSLQGDYYTISRASGVYAFNHYHPWPLTMGSIFHLPLGVMMRSGVDIFFRPKSYDESFRSHVVSRYGNTLYKHFFHDYTEKFIKLDPGSVHSDWAKGGLDRAVIDKRLKMDSLGDVARRVLFPKPVKTEFLYPRGGGIDMFCQRLADTITKHKGIIHVDAPARVSVGTNNMPQVSIAGKTHDCDLLIWTAPLPDLLTGVGLPRPELNYLATIFYQVVCDCPPLLPYQWCYFGDSDISFCRLSITSLMSPEASPENKHIITAEVTTLADDPLLQEPNTLHERIVDDLYRIKAIPRNTGILGVYPEILRQTYPIYQLDYPAVLAEALGKLGDYPRFIPLGRTGTFWYNNMDHSILQAMKQAEAILQGQ